MCATLPATRDEDRRAQEAHRTTTAVPGEVARNRPRREHEPGHHGEVRSSRPIPRDHRLHPARISLPRYRRGRCQRPTMSVPSMLITPSTMRLAGRQDDHQARSTFVTGQSNPPPMVSANDAEQRGAPRP